ncbi:uncharacterized protein LOC120529274 isoform X2 [Polypterus senegalus]|nr:uncharacterized protein LOC120529274 isoform X2 [Polypterus senegalus]
MNELLLIPVNSRIVLKCAGGSEDEQNVVWLKEGGAVPTGEEYSVFNSSFIIKNTKKSDCGIYSCVMGQNLSSLNKTYKLQVEGMPSLHTGTLVTSSLVLCLALLTAVPMILRLVKKIPGESGKVAVCFHVNWFFLPVFMSTAFLFWGAVEGFSVAVILSMFVHLLPIPYILHFDNCLFDHHEDYHILGFLCGTNILSQINSITLIVSVVVQAGKSCIVVTDLVPSAVVTILIILLLLFTSVAPAINYRIKNWKKQKKSQAYLQQWYKNLRKLQMETTRWMRESNLQKKGQLRKAAGPMRSAEQIRLVEPMRATECQQSLQLVNAPAIRRENQMYWCEQYERIKQGPELMTREEMMKHSEDHHRQECPRQPLRIKLHPPVVRRDSLKDATHVV